MEDGQRMNGIACTTGARPPAQVVGFSQCSLDRARAFVTADYQPARLPPSRQSSSSRQEGRQVGRHVLACTSSSRRPAPVVDHGHMYATLGHVQKPTKTVVRLVRLLDDEEGAAARRRHVPLVRHGWAGRRSLTPVVVARRRQERANVIEDDCRLPPARQPIVTKAVQCTTPHRNRKIEKE